MAYENRNAAYNLELFSDNAAEKLPKKKKKTEHKKNNKVVALPQEALVKIRRRKHNPFKLFVGTVAGIAITAIVAAIIVGQVQLTELNQQIITAKADLRNAQSTYTQRQMSLQADFTTNDIEKFARDELGMSKAENAQKEYISLSQGDKAEISDEANLNFFQRIINAITGLWS
ncbi:MAG: hypothetical protein IIU14_01765 [Ruminococcus sp.]|nr:hypothetical protein [Ruminococcus sp.]